MDFGFVSRGHFGEIIGSSNTFVRWLACLFWRT